MEKKHISIIGSCVSREMFNSSMLVNIFDVDCYAFKVCAWDLFGESLNISKEAFDKIEMPSFFARMLWYGFNKTTISEIEKCNSEYLLIDLLNINHSVNKLTLNGKSVYIQDDHNSFSFYEKQIRNVAEFSNIVSEKMTISEISKDVVLNGLKNLAEWAKEHFDETKIIINNFAISEGYYSLDNKYIAYEEQYLKDAGYDICEAWAYELKKLLPNAVFLNKVQGLISQHALYDGLNDNVASLVHFTNESYIKLGENLLKSVGIDYKDYFSHPLSPLGYECCMLKNSHIKLNDELKTLKSQSLNLSNYIKKFETPDDFLFLFTSKDGVVFNSATQRALAPIIDVNIPKANKFIAVVNKSKNFEEYKVSPNEPVIEYSTDYETIKVSSTGWGSTSKSEVLITYANGEVQKHSFNKKGLNFLVLNANTLEVVDKGNCNTNTAELVVFSEYINNVKINI